MFLITWGRSGPYSMTNSVTVAHTRLIRILLQFYIVGIIYSCTGRRYLCSITGQELVRWALQFVCHTLPWCLQWLIASRLSMIPHPVSWTKALLRLEFFNQERWLSRNDFSSKSIYCQREFSAEDPKTPAIVKTTFQNLGSNGRPMLGKEIEQHEQTKMFTEEEKERPSSVNILVLH